VENRTFRDERLFAVSQLKIACRRIYSFVTDIRCLISLQCMASGTFLDLDGGSPLDGMHLNIRLCELRADYLSQGPQFKGGRK
jgi:hypothetical protein